MHRLSRHNAQGPRCGADVGGGGWGGECKRGRGYRSPHQSCLGDHDGQFQCSRVSEKAAPHPSRLPAQPTTRLLLCVTNVRTAQSALKRPCASFSSSSARSTTQGLRLRVSAGSSVTALRRRTRDASIEPLGLIPTAGAMKCDSVKSYVRTLLA